MTTPTLRAAAEAALDTLDRYEAESAVADTLRAALAEDGRDWSLLAATQESLREHMAEIRTLRAALAQPVPDALPELPELPEPASRVVYNESKGYTWDAYNADQMRAYALAALAQPVPDATCNFPLCQSKEYQSMLAAQIHSELYTGAHPQRVPLKDSEVASCWSLTPWNADLKTRVFHFARVIERAHGIVPAPTTGEGQ